MGFHQSDLGEYLYHQIFLVEKILIFHDFEKDFLKQRLSN